MNQQEGNGQKNEFVEFYDVDEDARLVVSFLGEIKTANNRFNSRYVRANVSELTPNGELQNIGVKNLNLKRTVLRKEVEALESSGRLQAEPYVIFGRGEATTQDGMTKYYKYEVLGLSEARQKGLIEN
jgi:hypothetical protein